MVFRYAIILMLSLHACIAQNKSSKFDAESVMTRIEKDTTYRSFSVDYHDDYSEGSEVTGFYDNEKRIQKLISKHFGEMGKVTTVYYVYKDSLIYQKRQVFTYDRPFYMDGYKVKIDSSSGSCVSGSFKCDYISFRKELGVFERKFESLD